jgi:small subunit ribosomal protein S5
MAQAVKEKKQNEPALIEKVITIKRVTKVTKGGKNLGFVALVVVGDEQEQAGFATAKANDVANAIRKAIRRAKKSLVKIPKKNTTVPHEKIAKFGAVEILLKPAARGTGVIACAPVRAVCECFGIKDILTKIVKKSKNPVNVVKATFKGLTEMKMEEAEDEVEPDKKQQQEQES